MIYFFISTWVIQNCVKNKETGKLAVVCLVVTLASFNKDFKILAYSSTRGSSIVGISFLGFFNFLEPSSSTKSSGLLSIFSDI